jgi:aspartate racemase
MKLGVIGGLGPIATAYFLELITNMTDAKCDQDHLEMIIYSFPSIPDRTGYINGTCSDNPAIPIIEIAKELSCHSIDYISIPCITAHYFYDTVSRKIKTPVIHAIKETVLHLKDNNIKKVGIAATDGTLKTGLFQKELDTYKIDYILPEKSTQRKIMHIIYDNVKAGKPVDIELFTEITGEFRQKGAKVIVLGCTELSYIKRDYNIGTGFLDAMEVLAKVSIEACKKKVKGKYKCLIT